MPHPRQLVFAVLPALCSAACLSMIACGPSNNGHGMVSPDEATSDDPHKGARTNGPSTGSPSHATSVGGTMAAPSVHPATAAEEVMRERERGTSSTRVVKVRAGPSPSGADSAGSSGKQGLTSDEVQSVVKANRAQIDACFDVYKQDNATKAGRVDVTFEIHGDGRVHNPSFERDDFADAGLSSCINAHLSSWQFPTWSGQGKMRLTLPFAFNP